MKELRNLSILCFLLISIAWAQYEFDLKGTVINQADFPVNSLVVILKNAGYCDTTDTDGAFHIEGDPTSIVLKKQEKLPALKFKGTQFIVPVVSGGQNVSIEIYNLKGSKVATVFNRMLPEGEHAIPLIGNRTRHISSSVLIAVVKRGSDMSKFRIIKAGNNKFMVREFGGGVSNSSNLNKTARNAPVLDSLRFIRYLTIEGEDKELVEFTFPVEKLVDEFKVTLDLIPYEAIEWGKTQEDRNNEEVGVELKELNIYPYDLEKYNNSGQDWAWCSEFYSYCMRIGGCPLGDDEGSQTSPNWMVFSWNKLITWFEDNAIYIEKSKITSENYVPNPGDFIQLNEHTAMVRYIDSDDNVVCLDGNWGDKVVLEKRGNYKSFSGLNGYGRRSGIIENTCESISE